MRYMGTRSVLKIPVHNEKSPLMINLILYLNPTLIVQYFKTELSWFERKSKHKRLHIMHDRKGYFILFT